MTAELIYAHKGMDTYRTPKGIVQVIHRRDGEELFGVNYKGLHNAASKLRLLEGSGFTPKLLLETDRMMLQEDLGQPESPSEWAPDDWQDFRRRMVRLLNVIRRMKIRHGDLNGNNIIIKNKHPWIIDWQESHFTNEKPPQRMPLSDTHWVCQNLIRWIGNPVRSDPYRVVRRWAHIYGDLVGTAVDLRLKNKTLLDVGCFQGDFCAFAVAEQMSVVGIDSGGFRSGEDSIEIAKKLWDGIPFLTFFKTDVIEWPSFRFDVVLFMDTFPYVVRDYGKEAAIALLRRMASEAKRLYFETQMWGDQSGIEWLKTDEDVQALVPNMNWHKVTTIPENGIGRTLWRIEQMEVEHEPDRGSKKDSPK